MLYDDLLSLLIALAFEKYCDFRCFSVAPTLGAEVDPFIVVADSAPLSIRFFLSPPETHADGFP